MRGITIDANRFRQLRRACGLTQRELARLAGVGERTVRNAETGCRVRLDFLNFLAVALKCETLELVDDCDELRVALHEQRRVAHILKALEAYFKESNQSELFSLVSQDVLFVSPGPADIPLSGEFRGADGLRTFFDRSNESIAYEGAPQVRDIRTGGNLVVISGHHKLRAIPTGKSFTTPWMHVYEFDKGRIMRIDNWGDVCAVQRAFQPS